LLPGYLRVALRFLGGARQVSLSKGLIVCASDIVLMNFVLFACVDVHITHAGTLAVNEAIHCVARFVAHVYQLLGLLARAPDQHLLLLILKDVPKLFLSLAQGCALTLLLQLPLLLSSGFLLGM